MPQNARVADFTVSELLRENQQGGGGKITSPTQIRVKSMRTHQIALYINGNNATCF